MRRLIEGRYVFECDYGTCSAERDTREGRPGEAHRIAQVAGWRVSGRNHPVRCHCPAHKSEQLL